MKQIFVAEVTWWDEVSERDVTTVVLVQAKNFIDAVDEICKEFGDGDITKINNLYGIGEGYVVTLGTPEEAKEIIDKLETHNTY